MASDTDIQRIRVGDVLMEERQKLVAAVRRKLFDASDEDAEDLVSDVFFNVLRRGDLVSHVENLTAYLYRAIANRITDQRRSPRREQSLDCPAADGDDALRRALEPPSPDQTPEEALQRKQLRAELRWALDQLKENERAVWIATEIEGRSFRELAEEWGEPQGTLLSRKSRAGKLLRKLLAGQRGD